VGPLVRAVGGTLILRDLDTLAPPLQAELAAHLAREDADPGRRARVVATCGPDVEALVAAGALRPELVSRFGGRVRVPGLNERRADIPQLVYQMLRAVNAEEGTDVKRVPSDVIQALIDHDWRDGNLRALRGIIAAATVLAPGEALDRAAMPMRGRPWTPREALPELPGEVDRLPERYRGLSYAEFKERLLSDFMGSYVRDLLDATGGNVTGAARLAGLHRPNFRRLMKRYGIEFDDERDEDD
jgi:DNA-binding NtrC family response regulator